jgi:plasmid stabilization system protein ParE
VNWTEIAWRDLESTADHIAEDSPAYAASFVREIRDAARTLKEFPNRGRRVPEFDRASIRELFIQNYRLIYLTSDEAVFILGLIHAARDLGSVWSDERDEPE